MILKRIAKKLIEPDAANEDSRRQQYILSALLLGILGLSLAALGRTTFETLTLHSYPGTPPYILLIIALIFLGLYLVSRSHNFRTAAYVLVGIIGAAGGYCLYVWGITLPMGSLMLVLGIVMSSILINTRFSLIYAGGVSIILLGMGYMESAGIHRPNTYWTQNLGGISDAITFVFIIGVIAIVSWLSNREIEQSLARARRSERALQQERDLLEARVIERTKQLEESQREKIMQLYRFADFGRISSGLLHDIINPLTAVSLNLEQLSTKRRSDLVTQAVEGIKYIEHFVQAARKQIQNPHENRQFSPRQEIEELATTLASKLRSKRVKLLIDIPAPLQMFGSHIKFHQLISNLLSNAIDAYEDPNAKDRTVKISLREHQNHYSLTISDHGKGIPTDDIPKIFEPFFTTKPHDKGTGIGLFISRRIVEEDFAGTITAASSGSETIFTIHLMKNHD